MEHAPTAAAIDATPDGDKLPAIPVGDVTGAADSAIALFDAEVDRLESGPKKSRNCRERR